MGLLTDRQLKEYFNAIKRFMPVYKKDEKKFLSDLKDGIQDFRIDHPDCTMDGIYDRYGTPNQVVADYLIAANPEYLNKRVFLFRTLRRIFTFIVILVFLFFSIKASLLYKSYQKSNETIIVKETTIIE